MVKTFRAQLISAVILAAGLSAPALAQEISDSHLKAARAAIASINATDQFDSVLPAAAGALKVELIRKDPNLQQLISSTVDEKTLEMVNRRGDLEREAALAYARAFSEADLLEIAKFYESPAGKNLILNGPIVSREVAQAADIWQTGVARDLAESVGKSLQAAAPAAPVSADPAAPIITPAAEAPAPKP